MADAVAAISLLPPELAAEQLSGLCGALDEVDALNAAAVASALLDIVFPAEAYQPGAPLTGNQRSTIEAIAASDNAWEFGVNLAEVLRANGLPADRADLRALPGQARL